MHGQAQGRLRLKCIVLGSAGAGKTSILRRYFNNTFEHGRRSTMGADFYSRRIDNPVCGASRSASGVRDSGVSLQHSVSSASSDSGLNGASNSNLGESASRSDQRGRSRSSQKQEVQIKWDQSISGEPHVSLQCWDTAGRERFVSDNSSGLSSTLGNAFFSHADAAILVYDATSSRSFTQLIKWYSELMERMKTGVEYSKDTAGDKKRTKPVKTFPVLIVANKLDVLKRDVTKPIRRRIVPQRKVMKLNDGFKGKDHRYEYSVSNSPPRSELAEKTKKLSNDKHSSLSYGMTDTTWTSDNSYLNSVIKSEDGSFPDRDLAKLWCSRNGLKHIEVSALDGTGIHECISSMVKLALEAMNEGKEKEKADGGQKLVEDFWASRDYKTLDLHERYAPKEKPKLCWRLFPCCK